MSFLKYWGGGSDHLSSEGSDEWQVQYTMEPQRGVACPDPDIKKGLLEEMMPKPSRKIYMGGRGDT